MDHFKTKQLVIIHIKKKRNKLSNATVSQQQISYLSASLKDNVNVVYAEF